ncbi:MAG TPA: hypothetical protein VNG33_11665, partial [Polyangiaceae bacterium]|nr:hypothetical protein [Polyangiaceae bacterium]
MPATSPRRAALARQLLALGLGGQALFASPSAAAQTPVGAAQTPTADAATDDTTKQLLREGFSAMKRNDLEAARVAFAAAWAHRQHFVVALSLAEVETRLGRFVEAAEHWQYLLENLPAEHAEKRDAAREQLESCRTHIATLTLRVLPQDATVFIDEKPLDDAHLDGELYLEPGAHEVYASKDGRRSTAHTFRASPGSRFSFGLVISPAPAAQPTASLPKNAPDLPARTARPDGQSSVAAEHRSLRTPVLIGEAALAVISAAAG